MTATIVYPDTRLPIQDMTDIWGTDAATVDPGAFPISAGGFLNAVRKAMPPSQLHERLQRFTDMTREDAKSVVMLPLYDRRIAEAFNTARTASQEREQSLRASYDTLVAEYQGVGLDAPTWEEYKRSIESDILRVLIDFGIQGIAVLA